MRVCCIISLYHHNWRRSGYLVYSVRNSTDNSTNRRCSLHERAPYPVLIAWAPSHRPDFLQCQRGSCGSAWAQLGGMGMGLISFAPPPRLSAAAQGAFFKASGALFTENLGLDYRKFVF